MDKIALLEKIKIRLTQFHMEGSEMVFDDDDKNPILMELIDEAIADVKLCRGYPSYYSEDRVSKDLEGFKKVIIDLVVNDYNKLGADFESQNNENGIIRTYEKREKILANVLPLVAVIF